MTMKNLQIIWAHPCTGKTWLTERFPDKFLDMDVEFREDHQISLNIKRKEGHSRNYKAHEEGVWEKAKLVAKSSNRILLTSLRSVLRVHSHELDIIINIPYETFIKRVTERQIISIESAIEWKNEIEQTIAVNNLNVTTTTSYFSELPFIKNIIKSC